MMEVKHSSAVPLLDYVSPTSNDSNSATETSSKSPLKKLADDLIQNGDNMDEELDFQDAVDDTEQINSDLEDALLADDDDVIAEPKSTINLENLDKAENSTDPGDDLDKLLSKINDVVEGSDSIVTETKVADAAVNGTVMKEAKKSEEKPKEQKNHEQKNKEKIVDDKSKKVDNVVQEPMDVDETEKKETMDVIDEDDVSMLENVEKTTEKQDQEKQVESVLDANMDEDQSEKAIQNTSEAEQQKDKKKIEENNLEEGELAEQNKEDSKEDGELTEDDEIFTLVLDDDDEDVVCTESDSKAKTVKKLDKNIDESAEIVCLDDDEDEEMKETKNEQEVIKTEETEAKIGSELAKNESDKDILEISAESKTTDNESECETKTIELESVEMSQKELKADAESKNQKKIEHNDKLNEAENCGNENGCKAIKGEEESKIKENKRTQEAVIDIESKDSMIETESKGAEIEGELVKKSKESNVDKVDQESVDENVENKETKSVDTESKVSASETESKESESASKPQTAQKQGENPNDDLISDNTDNACDGLENAKAASKKPAEGVEAQNDPHDENEDARSDSSGSNLLQEGQAPSEASFGAQDEADEEDAECDNDDVELMEDSAVERNAENKNKIADNDRELEIPPAKRLRLSTESAGNDQAENAEEVAKIESDKEKEEKPENEKSNEAAMVVDEGTTTEATKHEPTNTSTVNLKRPFSTASETEATKVVSETEEVAAEGVLKKQKISDDAEETVAGEKVEVSEKSVEKDDIKEPLKTEDSKPNTDENFDVKPHIAVPSNKPIPLYPPPKFEETPKELSLDFLQRFRKSFNQMTKNDLEELVLQKIVEALVYENQFSDLRLIIEKQEKVIAMHRSKLAQLVKQYRDLEMVHTRVVKDMREKNSQYLMPVRITRAVGLQVSSPNVRKSDGPIAQVAPNNITTAATAGTMRAPQSIAQQQHLHQQQQQQQKRLTSPQRPQAIGTAATATSNVMLPSTSTTPIAAVAAATTSATNNQPVRRGCMQKVTAQRPVNGSNVVSSSTNPPMASIPASSYSARPMPMSSSSSAKAMAATSTINDNSTTNIVTRVLNKNAQAVNNANSRVRYGGVGANATSPIQQAQQARSPPQILNRQSVANNSAANKINAAVQNKIAQQAQFRRSDTSPTMGASNANKSNTSATYLEQYKNNFNQAMPTVSITPARPKDKSVIDLTDEDDMPTPPPSMTPRARQTPVNANNANSIAGNANSGNRQNLPPSLTRMPSGVSVRPQITPRQLSSMQKSNNALQQQQTGTTITTPSGMSITRVAVNQANPATQRLRYAHPAALPPTPPQQFNPGWKLPPPRPTIRISNLDNGIVISWTMEEPLERHADVTTYQIYAYQETNAPPSTDSWRHVGDVKAMLLPMAVTLTQFQEDQRYFFSVRAMDAHQRYGPFSAPKTWN